MVLTKYFIDIRHEGLGTFQRVQGTDPYVVQQRANAKQEEWDRQWERRQDAEARRLSVEHSRLQRKAAKEAKRDYLEFRKAEAEEATRDAEAAVAAIENILAHTLEVDDRVDFEAFKNRDAFPERRPERPKALQDPHEPAPSERKYIPEDLGFWWKLGEIFSPSLRRERIRKQAIEAEAVRKRAAAENAASITTWRNSCERVREANAASLQQYEVDLREWQDRLERYQSSQASANDSIDKLRERYLAHDLDAIEQHADMVLSASKYPESFPQSFLLQYDPVSKIVIVEYVLPLPEDLPRIKGVRYVQSRDELVETELAEGFRKKLYDSALYQIAIRTIHELFESDVEDVYNAIAFNGIVCSIDGATGASIRPCILTVQVSKTEFATIQLATVDPKACFRKLRGTGSAQLHALAPVPPVLTFKTDDARFVDGRNVISGVDDSANLATMDWGDFEHLIRDLFEKEFASSGSDVRVTRASRDGGIDAVIFDPDPIRGGKFVVQAKRYTNVVGVSAVRDLYGAMTNERAARGILVTTSAYGHDSYEFAKDKPITLLDGGRLLHLLQKHGVRARIDIAEARRIFGRV